MLLDELILVHEGQSGRGPSYLASCVASLGFLVKRLEGRPKGKGGSESAIRRSIRRLQAANLLRHDRVGDDEEDPLAKKVGWRFHFPFIDGVSQLTPPASSWGVTPDRRGGVTGDTWGGVTGETQSEISRKSRTTTTTSTPSEETSSPPTPPGGYVDVDEEIDCDWGEEAPTGADEPIVGETPTSRPSRQSDPSRVGAEAGAVGREAQEARRVVEAAADVESIDRGATDAEGAEESSRREGEPGAVEGLDDGADRAAAGDGDVDDCWHQSAATSEDEIEFRFAELEVMQERLRNLDRLGRPGCPTCVALMLGAGLSDAEKAVLVKLCVRKIDPNEWSQAERDVATRLRLDGLIDYKAGPVVNPPAHWHAGRIRHGGLGPLAFALALTTGIDARSLKPSRPLERAASPANAV